MFTEIYIEALLADQVWQLWADGTISDSEAQYERNDYRNYETHKLFDFLSVMHSQPYLLCLFDQKIVIDAVNIVRSSCVRFVAFLFRYHSFVKTY